jgi:hypothetical protein
MVLLAGMVGFRERVWFELTDELLDLDGGTMSIPAWLAKRGRAHRIYLTSIEQHLFREQLMIRASGTPLVFPTPTGCQWNCSGFRERVWDKAVAAAVITISATRNVLRFSKISTSICCGTRLAH